MFGHHFQSMFSPCSLTNNVLAAREACCRVVPHKVTTSDYDSLDRNFSKEELFVALSLMQNGNSLGMDGSRVSFTRPCGMSLGMNFVVWLLRCSSRQPSKFLNQGLIKLISKNATLDTIGG
jgi:hypothetical protein